MERLAALAKEKEAATRAAKESGLLPRAFGVYWTLRDDVGLKAAGVDTMELAREVETLFTRFPNAVTNAGTSSGACAQRSTGLSSG